MFTAMYTRMLPHITHTSQAGREAAESALSAANATIQDLQAQLQEARAAVSELGAAQQQRAAQLDAAREAQEMLEQVCACHAQRNRPGKLNVNMQWDWSWLAVCKCEMPGGAFTHALSPSAAADSTPQSLRSASCESYCKARILSFRRYLFPCPSPQHRFNQSWLQRHRPPAICCPALSSCSRAP